MKTRLKKRGMMKSPTALTSPSSTLAAPEKSVWIEHVHRFSLKQMNTVGYDHEKTKKEACERVVTKQDKKPKCPLGRKYKYDSCSLHPDWGWICNQQPKKNSATLCLCRKTFKQKKCHRGTQQTLSKN